MLKRQAGPRLEKSQQWGETTRIWAFEIKVWLQRLVGACVVLLLATKVAMLFGPAPTSAADAPTLLAALLQKPVLEIVAEALMYSAGIELAYMLFTPGPDEAVEPVILGLAAATLLVVSNSEFGLPAALVVAILAVAIGVLFYVRGRFLPPPNDDGSGPESSTSSDPAP